MTQKEFKDEQRKLTVKQLKKEIRAFYAHIDSDGSYSTSDMIRVKLQEEVLDEKLAV